MPLIKQYHAEPKIERPKNTAEKRSLVKQIYQWNGWHKTEHKDFCEMEDLPLKGLDYYNTAELDKFLSIFEQAKMGLFTN